jgi:hypothetical protein
LCKAFSIARASAAPNLLIAILQPCYAILTLEAIATDPNATPADPRDLFIRLELLSYELRGATFRVRECWWPSGNGGSRP